MNRRDRIEACIERASVALRDVRLAPSALRRLLILQIDEPHAQAAAIFTYLQATGDASSPLAKSAFRTVAVSGSRIRSAAGVFLFNLLSGGEADGTFPAGPGSASLMAVMRWLYRVWVRRDAPPFPAITGPDFADAGETIQLAANVLGELGQLERCRSLRSRWARIEGKVWRSSDVLLLAPMANKLIGHLVIVASMIAMQRAGLISWRLAPISRSSDNPYLFDLLAPHFKSAENASSASIEVFNGSKDYLLDNGETVSTIQMISRAAGFWLDASRRVVELPESLAEAGRRQLAGLGYRGGWFVTLHVRAQSGSSTVTSFRNPPIASYRAAIETIVGAGGTVVRLGDASMPEAEPIPGLIDYPFTAAKSDWMDIFLAAHCRFHIGTASGMSFVPLLFGRPVLFTNWTPVRDMISAPTVYTMFRTAETLDGHAIDAATLFDRWPDTARLPFARCLGFRLIDNEPGDLAEAAAFMLARVEADGRLRGGFDDGQQPVAGFMKAHGFADPPRVPPGFWDRWGDRSSPAADLPPATAAAPSAS